MRENKSFQFLVGCFTLFLVYKLYAIGAFDWFFSEETEGYESVPLVTLFITAAVSAVQMVGLVAIMIVGGLAPTAERAVDYLRAKMPKLNLVATKIEDQVDTEKLTSALNNIDERIRSIELKIGDKP